MPTLTRFFLGTAAATLLGIVNYTQAQAARPSLTGNWSGTLGPLEFTAHLTDPTIGPRTATMDIPEQHANELAL